MVKILNLTLLVYTTIFIHIWTASQEAYARKIDCICKLWKAYKINPDTPPPALFAHKGLQYRHHIVVNFGSILKS